MKNIGIMLAAAAISVVSPVSAKEPQLTGLALQQIQARDIETPTDVAFPAVMTVLQDSGYRILAADRTTGLISAIGSAQSKLTYNIWHGIGKKKDVPMVSAFIERRTPTLTRIRLNFVISKGKSRDSFTDETPVSDPAVYKDAFERIDREVFTRHAMNAPVATPAPLLSPSTTLEPPKATPPVQTPVSRAPSS